MLANKGGIVVSRNNPVFDYGERIPPTEVEVVRPSNVDAIAEER